LFIHKKHFKLHNQKKNILDYTIYYLKNYVKLHNLKMYFNCIIQNTFFFDLEYILNYTNQNTFIHYTINNIFVQSKMRIFLNPKIHFILYK